MFCDPTRSLLHLRVVPTTLVLMAAGAAIATYACKPPDVARIVIAPRTDLRVGVGVEFPKPTARAVDADGNSLPVGVTCVSNSANIVIERWSMHVTEPVDAKVVCRSQDVTAEYRVKTVPTYASPSTGYALVKVPPGSFTMGPDDTHGRPAAEGRGHTVTLTRPFLIGATEVTQAQWYQVMQTQPSRPGWEGIQTRGPSFPVHHVNWCDAILFSNALSRMDGLSPAYRVPLGMTPHMPAAGCDHLAPDVRWLPDADGYRLPTEAEWEYAARAGTRDRWSGTDREEDVCRFANTADLAAAEALPDRDASSCDDQSAGPFIVGQYTPNAFAVHDMTGSVWEWTWDVYAPYPAGATSDPTGAEAGSDRVTRGGSWMNAAARGTVAHREELPPGFHFMGLGFRLARSASVRPREAP